MKKKAFTLAEVLIALAVIGVIAAVTVPAVIQNTQKQEIITSLKKAYSVLSQVTNKILMEEGSPNAQYGGWAQNAESVFQMYKKYLNNAKVCGVEEGCAVTRVKFLDGVRTHSFDDNTAYRRLVLADGIQIIFQALSANCTGGTGNYDTGSINVCAPISVDVNGSKNPNQIGRDIFMFVLKEDGLHPAGCDQDGHCSKTRNDWNMGCACKVLREGAMNY